eukprot:1473040-Amphidinium_carterae.1
MTSTNPGIQQRRRGALAAAVEKKVPKAELQVGNGPEIQRSKDEMVARLRALGYSNRAYRACAERDGAVEETESLSNPESFCERDMKLGLLSGLLPVPPIQDQHNSIATAAWSWTCHRAKVVLINEQSNNVYAAVLDVEDALQQWRMCSTRISLPRSEN